MKIVRMGTPLAGTLLVVLASSACDPCDGVLGCESGVDVSAGGTLIEFHSGEPAEGVTLDFLHRGGVGVARDSVRVVTGDDGRFRFGVDAAEEGEALFEVRVAAPGQDPYRLELSLMASGVRGEGRELGRWTTRPYLGFSGELTPSYRWEPGCFGALAPDLAVRFERTGGLAVEPNPVRGVVDGRTVVLFARPESAIGRGGVFGPVSGTLTVSNEREGTVVSEVPVETDVRYEDAVPHGGVVTFALSLHWAGEVYRRSGGEKIPLHPAEVEFRRTGGIEVCPERFVRPVRPWGGFSLSMATVTEGEVVGDLIVRAPGGLRDTIAGVRIPTFRTGGFPLLERWGVGGQINYAATFYFADTGQAIAGADVEFRRTGGIRIEPERFTRATTSWGAIPITPHTDEEGVLVGEFRVMLPEGTVVIEDVQIPTFEADELRFLGAFAVTRPSP